MSATVKQAGEDTDSDAVAEMLRLFAGRRGEKRLARKRPVSTTNEEILELNQCPRVPALDRGWEK
jgi:hypothetical protein